VEQQCFKDLFSIFKCLQLSSNLGSKFVSKTFHIPFNLD